MFRIFRYLYKNNKTKDLPNRIDIIKSLDKNESQKICNNFKSYGSFVNFCISEKISVRSKQRRELLSIFIKPPKKK